MKSKRETRYIIELQSKENWMWVPANRALADVLTEHVVSSRLRCSIDYRAWIDDIIAGSKLWGESRIIRRTTKVTELVVSEQVIDSILEPAVFQEDQNV